jgi:type VI protein secretion system component VasF
LPGQSTDDSFTPQFPIEAGQAKRASFQVHFHYTTAPGHTVFKTLSSMRST